MEGAEARKRDRAPAITAAIRSGGLTARTGPISACRCRFPTRSTFSAHAKCSTSCAAVLAILAACGRTRLSGAADHAVLIAAVTEWIGLSRLRHLPDKGKLAIAMGEVHAVAHHKDRRTAEPHEIRHDRRRARHVLVDEDAGLDRFGAAFRKERLGKSVRPESRMSSMITTSRPEERARRRARRGPPRRETVPAP